MRARFVDEGDVRRASSEKKCFHTLFVHTHSHIAAKCIYLYKLGASTDFSALVGFTVRPGA